MLVSRLTFYFKVCSMKYRLLFLLCLFATAGVIGQAIDPVKVLVKEGIALHDQGQYDAAIAKYDSAIKMDANNFDAYYEKSLSFLFAKRYEDCIDVSKYLLRQHSDNPSIKEVYSNYGSALDDAGKPEDAIAIFEKGIKKFPDYYLLHYNKALTLGRMKRWDDAMPFFMNALRNKPNHAGSLYYVSMGLENSNKVAAILCCITFLSIEPEGKRAESTLKYLKELMGSFAKKGDGGNSVITIDAGDIGNKKKENNFSMVQMMLGLTVASGFKDSTGIKTEIDQLSSQVQMLAASLSNGAKDGKGLFWEVYAPFIVKMNEAGLVPVFAHIGSITSGDERNIQWINAHQEKLVDFKNFIEGYEWPKAK